jgi:cardiolipin synthase
VRLLVPGASDIPVVSPLSRAGYRPLLEAGVRVFEWNGSMLHAKTAVADDRWARVGSTNLNIASLWANYELDVAVEDEHFATAMASMYEQDLEHATEIVLAPQNRVRPTVRRRRRSTKRWRPRSGSAGRAAAGALSIGSAVGAAITDHRVLGPAEARVLVMAALALLTVAGLGLVWPWLLAVPFGVMAGWLGITLLVRAVRLFGARGAIELGDEGATNIGPRRRTSVRDVAGDVAGHVAGEAVPADAKSVEAQAGDAKVADPPAP